MHPSQGEAILAAPAADLTFAVAELERFRSRPIRLLFLTSALRQRGLWQELEQALDDWAISDGEGMEVIDMLRNASPQARCGPLKQLAESMSDPAAEALASATRSSLRAMARRADRRCTLR